MAYKILDPSTTFIDDQSTIGDGVVIHPFCVIENSTIEASAEILSFCHISSSRVGEGAKVRSSFVESSVIEKNATIGPFAHLRPGSHVGEGARIGNFVEIKNSLVGAGTKVSHLSYVGDADIGNGVNIGCGVVFINYDGKRKQRSRVGDGSFIGSSVNVIAPVSIGEKAYVCAGTTVDRDVKSGSFAIGRSRMQEKENRAKDYLKGD